jgi:hypothetical protein
MSAFAEKSQSIPNSSSVESLITNNIKDTNNQVNIQMGENGRAGYKTTGNYCVDMFSLLSRGVSVDKINDMFTKAYIENQEIALKIMMNYRDRNGKQEKDIPRQMMKLLKMKCPATYIANLLHFVNNGYLKDLCELVHDTRNIDNISNGIEAKIFATLLIADIEALNNNEEISLCGKWAPRQQSKYSYLVSEIAGHLPGMENANIKTKLKSYRKDYCTPLNAKLNTLEVNMTAKNYDKITIEHIPATALKKTKKALLARMPEKYAEYLNRCKGGEIKMKTTGIQPHELTTQILQGDETAEIQLNEIIRKLRESGLFENTLPVCDVSGSMNGVPMQVSVMMGYIVSQLQNDNFKNKVITFSSDPQLVELAGNTTKDKLQSLHDAPWGMNTDFIKTFKMLLENAKQNRINEKDMVKKIIVFTDMQFDQANSSRGAYETAHQEITKMYEKEGLTLPQIIYWNLRDATISIPVTCNTPGVALMNGFSSEMLKTFMDNGEITPYDIMMKAIDKYEVVSLGEVIDL